MLLVFFEIYLYFGIALKCPEKHNDYLDLPSSPQPGNRYYACNKEFGYDGQFGLTNSILSIYYCTFKNIVAIYNKESLGIIKIKIDKDMGSNIKGNVNIEYCSFESSYGAILIDSTDSSTEFNIYNCTFTRCQSMKGAAMIDFKSTNGRIEKCHFLDCLTIDSTSGYVCFNPPKIENNDQVFRVIDNVFEHSIQNSYAFLAINNDYGRLNFSNNKAIIPELRIELYVIRYPNSASFDGWTFSGNCISPFRPDAITSTNNQKIVDSFSDCQSEGAACPPILIPDSKKYSSLCYENQEDNITEIAVKNKLIALFYCNFSSIRSSENNENKGGAVYIFVNFEFDDNYLPFFIHNCDFKNCKAFRGGAIYIESINAYTSYVFEIKDCKFYSNKAYTEQGAFGGAICIIAGDTDFAISDSEFDSNEADQGGAIYYSNSLSSSSSSSSNANTLSDDKYSMSIVDCKFVMNKATENGAAICIVVEKVQPDSPIDINKCFFSENSAGKYELSEIEKELHGNGGAIYFGFDVTSSRNNNFAFHVIECNFSFNVAYSKGGAVCISIAKKEPFDSIEIYHCSFVQNQANAPIEIQSYGSDICYIHDSKNLFYTNNLLETSFALKINDCNFADGLSKHRGGSIYISITNEQASKSIEIKSCLFKNITSSFGGAIDIQSSSLSVLFHVFDCEFQGKSSIFFNGINGLVEKCCFNDINEVIPIHYECNSSEKTSESNSFTVEKCSFDQSNEIYSLVFFVPKVSSRFVFTNNDIKIRNNKTFVFNCNSDESLKGKWKFNDNSIFPDNENLIKSENATSIHFRASCFTGFICTSQQTPGFECEKDKRCSVNGNEQSSLSFIDVSNSNFKGLKDEEGKGGGAIYLLNYGIFCQKASFNECLSENEGGGAIYIHLNEILESIVSLKEVSFTKCTAVYGGALYIYSDQEDNRIEINSCTFVQNKAKKKEEVERRSVLHSGSAIYITVKNGEIKNCLFIKNVGNSIMASREFENVFKAIKEIKDEESLEKIVLIENCSFDTELNSSSSIYFVHLKKNKTQNDSK